MSMDASDTDAVRAAHDVAARSAAALQSSVAFRQLPVAAQQAVLRDLGTLRRGFASAAAAPRGQTTFAETLAPRRQLFGSTPTSPPADPAAAQSPEAAPKPRSATASLAANAGALSDEVDFPTFVAGLVHGTFDAMVDASIRQMETYADLVATVARGLDDFTRDNVSRGQVIDWLSERYPRDLERDVPLDGSGEPRLLVRAPAEGEDERQPAWLADFGIEDEALSDELIEEQLIPAARRAVGESRLKSLATMVLLGLNRIVVKDGTISARVRFRAAARDTAKVAYATGQDAGATPWGERGGYTYAPPSTMVSTVGVNVQAESDLKVELFGEVKINFASETLPLDRFASAAQIQLLESHAGRPAGGTIPRSTAAPAPAPPAAPPAGEAAAPSPAAAPAPQTGGAR
jgi:hypothetical protein